MKKIINEIENEVKKLKKQSRKLKKKTSIIITLTTQKSNWKMKIFPVRILENIICLPIGIKNDTDAIEIIKKFDGVVNIFFIDAENKLIKCQDLLQKTQKIIKKSTVYPIKGNDFSADAAYAIILEIFKNVNHKNFCVVGAGNIGSKVALKLIELGSNVFILNSNYSSSKKTASAINTLKPNECIQKAKPIDKLKIPEKLDGILGFTRGVPVITSDFVKKIKKGGILFDGGTGTITDEAIKYAKIKKLKVLKLDIRMGFESNIILMQNTRKLILEISGKKKMNGFDLVSGGHIGNHGDIVVDNFKKPTKIFGVANGCGGLLDKVESEKFITKNKVIF